MLAAYHEWKDIATEMSSDVVAPLKELLQGLQEQWSGPSAEQMAATAAPIHQWLIDLSCQLFKARQGAFDFYLAYLGARNRMVPPQDIIALRGQRQQLVANNAFGLNAAAIATIDQQYQQYWDQDVYVMRVYDSKVSRVWSKMTPWKPPPMSNKAGLIEEAGYGLGLD